MCNIKKKKTSKLLYQARDNEDWGQLVVLGAWCMLPHQPPLFVFLIDPSLLPTPAL
jgi:hypothetical protein